MELFKLFGSVLIEDEKAIKALKGIDKKGESTGQKLGKIADKGLMIGTAIVGAGIAVGTALFGITTKAAETADRVDKLSQKIGLSRQGFQEWDYIMSQNGMTVDQLQMGFKTLVTQIDQAVDGTGKGAESFKKLGISVVDTNGKVKSQETVFNEAVIALQGMEEGTEKAKLANDLFGRSGAEMMPLLNGASGSVEELRKKANELGLVMSDDAVDAGVLFTDTMDTLKRSFGMIFTELGVQLMPTFQRLSEWFIANLPTIKEFIANGLEKVSTAMRWITDNSNILIPILGGVVGAFVAMKIIGIVSGLMAAYTAFTTTATGVQIGLNAAMMANPIGLVVLAIMALIAIGIALYMNWDKIKEAAISLWNKMKEVFNGIRTSVTSAVDNIKAKVSAVFSTIGAILIAPFNFAMGIIKGVVDKIKAFFNFQVSLPKIKLPHFKIKPAGWELGDLLKGKIPSLGIDWYSKGGIFDRPTIFPTASGFKGVGEAGPEAVTPISVLLDYVRTAVRENNNTDQVVNAIENMTQRMTGLQVVMETGAVVGALASPMDKELSKMMDRRGR